MRNQIKEFSEQVADFAVRNGYPITEEGFEQALNDYLDEQLGTLARLQENPEPVARLMFGKALATATVN